MSATAASMDYNTLIEICIAVAIGFILCYMITSSKKKRWFLETMGPRQQYEVGAEKKLIAHMALRDRLFYGVEAGKYKILLIYGDLATFSKPILSGKLEEMYSTVLANSFLNRNMVSRVEKWHFLDFLWKHIPSLAVKAHMITGELVSPQEVLEYYWTKGPDRDQAFIEMKRRGLIDSKVLWIRPYPPEMQLKDIMTGVLQIPHILQGHIMEYNKLTHTSRTTLMAMDAEISLMLQEVISLEREIVVSISDPLHVISLVISDRIRKVKGLGLEQLAEKGSAQAVIDIAKVLREHKDELVKAFEVLPSSNEMSAVEKRMLELDSKMSMIMARLSEQTSKTQAPAVPAQIPQAK